jgi:hypothetical protein
MKVAPVLQKPTYAEHWICLTLEIIVHNDNSNSKLYVAKEHLSLLVLCNQHYRTRVCLKQAQFMPWLQKTHSNTYGEMHLFNIILQTFLLLIFTWQIFCKNFQNHVVAQDYSSSIKTITSHNSCYEPVSNSNLFRSNLLFVYQRRQPYTLQQLSLTLDSVMWIAVTQRDFKTSSISKGRTFWNNRAHFS